MTIHARLREDKPRIIELIAERRGNLSAVAMDMGCSGSAIARRVRNDKDLQRALWQQITIWKALNDDVLRFLVARLRIDTGEFIVHLPRQIPRAGRFDEHELYSNPDRARNLSSRRYGYSRTDWIPAHLCPPGWRTINITVPDPAERLCAKCGGRFIGSNYLCNPCRARQSAFYRAQYKRFNLYGNAQPPETKICPQCGRRKRAGAFNRDSWHRWLS